MGYSYHVDRWATRTKVKRQKCLLEQPSANQPSSIVIAGGLSWSKNELLTEFALSALEPCLWEVGKNFVATMARNYLILALSAKRRLPARMHDFVHIAVKIILWRRSYEVFSTNDFVGGDYGV